MWSKNFYISKDVGLTYNISFFQINQNLNDMLEKLENQDMSRLVKCTCNLHA